MSEVKVQDPLVGCPVCNGKGEYWSERKECDTDCPCILLDASMSKEDKMEAMNAFKETLDGQVLVRTVELPTNIMALEGERRENCANRIVDVHKAVRERGLDAVRETHPTTVQWIEERGYDKLLNTEFGVMVKRTLEQGNENDG